MTVRSVEPPRGRVDLEPGGLGGPMSRRGHAKAPARSGDVATNRQARFKYHLLENWETGIALQGSEVKSLRDGKVNLKDSFALVRDGEVWLHNCHIAPYEPAAREGHDPERPRKLLMHRREIERLIGKTQEKGLTLIPTRIYFSGPGRRSSWRWRAARTTTTSGMRSGSATSAATWSASCGARTDGPWTDVLGQGRWRS